MVTDTCTSGMSCHEQRKPKDSLINAYGNWLNSMPWDYYCTFTTRYQLSLKSSRRSMIRLYAFLSEKYGCTTKLFWVAEPFDTKYGCHVHALIDVGDKALITSIDLKKAWQVVSKGRGKKEYNNTVIKNYDNGKGGHFYLSKYLQRQGVDYDVF